MSDSHERRARALRDAVCQIWSATGKYAHEIPRLCREALDRDNAMLDEASASDARLTQPEGSQASGSATPDRLSSSSDPASGWEPPRSTEKSMRDGTDSGNATSSRTASINEKADTSCISCGDGEYRDGRCHGGAGDCAYPFPAGGRFK